MTLLDAPQYDKARANRRSLMLYSGAGLLFVLFIVFWLVSGRPIDWPWTWYDHLTGRAATNHFLVAVEQDDLQKAYGIWQHDPDWQQHPQKYDGYPFARFQQDWSPTSSDNEYGVIKTHRIAAAHVEGNVLLLAVLINGRKSGALNLAYAPKSHTLNFSPPDMEINPAYYSK